MVIIWKESPDEKKNANNINTFLIINSEKHESFENKEHIKENGNSKHSFTESFLHLYDVILNIANAF